MSTNDEASDTGNHSPRDPVADSSAADSGTYVDEPGTSMDKETKWTIIVPLEQHTIKCSWCENEGRNVEFLNISDLCKHTENQHYGVATEWECRSCSKRFGKLHGWRCHFPKCRGLGRVEKEFKCSHCQESFDSRMGLSMHERHRHPVIRNLRRREHAERPQGKPGRLQTVWSEEEVVKLKELNERFKHEKYPNVKIREYLPQKTLKQISDKRRRLVDDPLQEEVVSDEEDPLQEEAVSDSEQASVPEEQIAQRPEQGTQELVTDDTWKQAIREHVSQIIVQDTSAFHSISERIDEFITRGGNDQVEIDLMMSSLIEELTKNDKENSNAVQNKVNREKGNSEKHQHRRKKKVSNRNRRTEFNYARCQEVYKKCPNKLVDLAISGAIPGMRQTLPKKEDVAKLYKQLWGTEGPEATLPDVEGNQAEVETAQVLRPITVQEVVRRMNKIKAKTAAGLDGISKAHLRQQGAVQVVTKIYNLLILFEYFPQAWKRNRTTLIPKEGKDAEDVRNWRPITIGSLLSRTFSAILDTRLRTFIKLSPRQKGFTAEDGCKGNIKLLDCALSRMKTEKGGVVTVVDISKAFDTIPHSVLEKCLARKGTPSTVAKFIRSMYGNISTVIRAREDAEVEVRLKRGVKQGDPLSPLLFNLVVDPIIEEINETTVGLKIEEQNLAVLAFADDMVLLAKNKRTAQQQIARLDSFLESLGMTLSIPKCSAFEIVAQQKTWYLKDPELSVRNEKVPNVEPEDVIRYLGANRSPWMGARNMIDISKIVKAVSNVKRLALKPHQKINLIRVYLLPRFIHGLVASPPAITILSSLDQQVKQVVKEILKLHKSTTDGIIYSNKRHGGLGMPRIENIVKLAALRTSLKMKESADPIQRCVAGIQEARTATYAKSMGIQWPSTLDDIEEARKRLRKQETDRWEQLISQGQGVRDFRRDEIGNAWLYNPTLLKPSRYLDALRLRTNTVGTRIAMKRANSQINTRCRRCDGQLETLAHILGACTHTKPQRMRRHDEIKEMIGTKAAKECVVFEEPTINVIGELKKPDLVIKDQERLYIVDVTVRYENGASLRNAAKEKEHKYKDTAELTRIKTGCTSAEVLPIVVGSRGAIPYQTRAHLRRLGFTKGEIVTVSMIALRSSIEMVNAFLDYDWTI